MIAAIAGHDEATMARLAYEHWELTRHSMQMFVVPREMKSDAVSPDLRRRHRSGAP